MLVIADLHLHSKYSRAVSPEMVLGKMAWWGKRKGINLLGTGDFTHPLWLREIKANLEEVKEGIYGLKKTLGEDALSAFQPTPQSLDSSISGHSTQSPSESGVRGALEKGISHLPKRNDPFFLLSAEISSIYSQGGKARRIHNVVLAPSIEIVEKINNELIKRGCNLHSDGRPIIGIPAKDLVKIILEIDERCLIIPAHIWTPWFSVYGSQSGFDSIEECFGEMSKYIYGAETGLSSDPAMNWRIADLDHRSLLSSSDAHSGPKLGREATVFEVEEVSYENIRKAIIEPCMTVDDRKSKIVVENRGLKIEDQSSNLHSQLPSSMLHHPSSNYIAHTLEFYPEEGKYHYTGHRACGVKQTPEETRRLGTTCPTCGRKLTVGVMHRVDELAADEKGLEVKEEKDGNGVRWIGYKDRPPYAMLVPLQEIIAESLGSAPANIKVQNEYNKLVGGIGGFGEFEILLKTPISEIAKISGEKIAEGVKRVRSGEMSVDPGYDGVFGVVKIWGNEGNKGDGGDEGEEKKEQMTLFRD